MIAAIPVLARLLWAGPAADASTQPAAATEAGAARDPAPPLSWHSPPGCPQRDDLVRAIEALLGAPMAAPDQGTLAIEGSIEPDQARWRLRLRIVTDSGERTRELPGATCQELLEVAAVLVAVAVDPRVAGVTDEPPVDDVVAPEAPAPTKTPTPVTPEPSGRTTPRRPALGASVALQGALVFGPLPRIAGGLGGLVALRMPHARVELEGTFVWPSSTASSDRGRSVIGLWQLGVRGCGVPRFDRADRRWAIELPVCGGVQAGAMRGQARGVAQPGHGTLPYLALDAGVGALVLLGRARRLGPRLDVRGSVPLLRPGFRIDDAVVFRARAAGLTATVGLELRLR